MGFVSSDEGNKSWNKLIGVDQTKKLLHREQNYLKKKKKKKQKKQKATYLMGGNSWTQHTWYSQYTKNSYNSSSKKKERKQSKVGRGCEYSPNRHKNGQQTEKDVSHY